MLPITRSYSNVHIIISNILSEQKKVYVMHVNICTTFLVISTVLNVGI